MYMHVHKPSHGHFKQALRPLWLDQGSFLMMTSGALLTFASCSRRTAVSISLLLPGKLHAISASYTGLEYNHAGAELQ